MPIALAINNYPNTLTKNMNNMCRGLTAFNDRGCYGVVVEFVATLSTRLHRWCIRFA
jgi:hypothetical protein